MLVLPEANHSTSVPQTEWPTLISLDSPNLPGLQGTILPTWAGSFSHALSESTETPPELAIAMVLAACSAACAIHYRVKVKDGYFEPTNLWFAAALPPGNRKSAVQSAATAPLLSWEKVKADEMGPEINQAVSAYKTAEARSKELRNKAAREKDPLKAKTLAIELEEIEASMPQIPRPPQLWTSDSTPERLGTILAENNECMAWLSSEGGVFDLLSGRYSGGIPNLDLVLKAHSGDAERVDRGSRPPVFLRNPLLTLGLSPQPDVLKGLATKPNFRGRGLLGRFLYLLPQSPLGYRTLENRPIPQSVEANYHSGLYAILDTPHANDACGKTEVYTINLSGDAYREWHAFARHVEVQLRPAGDFENAADWAGKAPGAAIRLAGVLHVIADVYKAPANIPISLSTMQAALEIMAVISQHSLHALDLMGADATVGAARTVWEWIKRRQPVELTIRDIHQALKGTFPRLKALKEALDVLVERGYLMVNESKNVGVGRPASPTITIRPDIAKGWAR